MQNCFTVLTAFPVFRSNALKRHGNHGLVVHPAFMHHETSAAVLGLGVVGCLGFWAIWGFGLFGVFLHHLEVVPLEISPAALPDQYLQRSAAPRSVAAWCLLLFVSATPALLTRVQSTGTGAAAVLFVLVLVVVLQIV